MSLTAWKPRPIPPLPQITLVDPLHIGMTNLSPTRIILPNLVRLARLAPLGDEELAFLGCRHDSRLLKVEVLPVVGLQQVCITNAGHACDLDLNLQRLLPLELVKRQVVEGAARRRPLDLIDEAHLHIEKLVQRLLMPVKDLVAAIVETLGAPPDATGGGVRIVVPLDLERNAAMAGGNQDAVDGPEILGGCQV